MGNINDRKDKAGGRQLAEALVRDKGWGTSAKYGRRTCPDENITG